MHDESVVTRYEAAQEVWDQRIGAAKRQAKNWRLACIIALLVTVLLAIALLLALKQSKTYVYVAEVKAGEQVANVKPIAEGVTPTEAQQLYFLKTFIHHIMSLPLDPVQIRTQWLEAYQMVKGRARQQLTQYARTHDPFAAVGIQTQTVHVKSFHPIGQNTFEVTWVRTTYNNQGQVAGVKIYNGSFTLTRVDLPTDLARLLENPFGLQIVYFNIGEEG